MYAPKPEGLIPADVHYDVEESRRYHRSSRINQVQRELTERCIELLELPLTFAGPGKPLILDVGCGSGISGEVLNENELPWIGVDIAPAMLELAKEEHPTGEFVRMDIGETQNLMPGAFDAAISVSVVQWLCHAFTSEQEPLKRLHRFFQWLFRSLNKSGRAVLQFYPSHQSQIDMIGKAAAHSGFSTYFIVDNADSAKKSKVFLICTVGQPEAASIIANTIASTARTKKTRTAETRKQYVIRKKEKMRRQGKQVKSDSQYSGRKRKDRL